MPKILVIHEDPAAQDSLVRFLEERGISVLRALADEVRPLLSVDAPSAVVVARALPDADTFALCRSVHDAERRIPLLLLISGVADVADRILAFEAGADDVMAGPAAPAEVEARLRALVRRAGIAAGPGTLEIADLRIDRARHRVTRAGTEIPLTLTEFRLLEYLARRKNVALTRREILEAVWGGTVEGFTNIVDVYVNYLRKKIERGDRLKLLKTVRGVGYLLEDPAPEHRPDLSVAP